MAGKGGKGKKGKKKKEKKAKDTEEKMPAVDRQFYELTITDLNNKLSRLRAHNAKIEEINEDVTTKMREFEEDRGDVTAFLDRQLAEKTDVIKEMDERLADLTRVREEENLEAANKIKELEQKNKITHDELSSEIKLLNGKLNSLEEFRVHKDELMARFDEQEEILRDKERSHAKVIYEMERKVLLEKDQLKKEVEKRLLRLSDEFTRSNEIRMAGYTKRLIRENISLDNEMDRMMASQKKIEEENNNMRARAVELEQLFATNEAIKQRLVKTCQHQVGIIEKLTDCYDALKTKHAQYVLYKAQYENNLKKDICDKFTLGDMQKKIRVLCQRIENCKAEKSNIIAQNMKLQSDINQLKDVLKNIKFTVRSAIRSAKDCSDDRAFRKAQRNTLLQQLMDILTSTPDEEIHSIKTLSSEFYLPGSAGLMRRSQSLIEILKREARKISTVQEVEAVPPKPIVGKIIPKPRQLDGETLFDVETVSSLSLSIAAESEEFLEEEEDLLGEDTKYASSSGSDVTKKTEKVEKAPKKEPSKNSLCDDISKKSGVDAEEIDMEIEMEGDLEEESEEDQRF